MIRRALGFAIAIALVTTLVPVIGPPPAGEASGIIAGRVRKDFQPNKGKIFVLVIGNDARSGNPDRVRADALHVIGINTRTMRGGILNFPRDSWVTIPGGGSGRINEALYRGGPRLEVRTIESITGIKIDYWVMTGFEGFRKIIRSIGPVRYTFRRDLFDQSGANIKAGRRKLGPDQALGFVRARKSFPRGDIDRTTNQGRFLLALLRKFHGSVDRNPAALLNWMATTQRNTRLDMSADEMFRLGVLATQLSPKRFGSVTVPVRIGSVGSASVVFIQPGARAIYRRFRRTATL